MKKIININLSGRAIPIEDTAYEKLQEYVESLRRYFAQEEGREEIINDIENRIAELFSERIKKGRLCITGDDVNAVIADIGRPEDFDEEVTGKAAEDTGSSYQQQSSQQARPQNTSKTRTERLYRDADDQMVGGVCSGLANYFGFDPAILRVIFVLLFGALFWVYIILWIIVPSRSIQSNITKRLYRNEEDSVVAGVCSGLAAYFNIDVWIPRLVFILPVVVSFISGPFNFGWNDWSFWWAPKIVTGSLTSSLCVAYIILWISVPKATNAAEKLEMRGDKIDLNSIRDTVRESAQQVRSKTRKNIGRIFYFIGSIFKGFFFFIAAIICVVLLIILIALFGASIALIPFRDYFLENTAQHVLTWATVLFFFGVPILALIVLLIRKISGSKRSPYVAHSFDGLWLVGLLSLIALVVGIRRNFKVKARAQYDFVLPQPVKDRMIIKISGSKLEYYTSWWGFGRSVRFTDDSLELSNVALKIERSPDTSYHIHCIKYSNGRNSRQAEALVNNIDYTITQKDSIVYLNKGFFIKWGDKFRNQHVAVIIQVPVGRKIVVDGNMDSLNTWSSIGFHKNLSAGNNKRQNNWSFNWNKEDDGETGSEWKSNVEYIMTPYGLQRVADSGAMPAVPDAPGEDLPVESSEIDLRWES